MYTRFFHFFSLTLDICKFKKAQKQKVNLHIALLNIGEFDYLRFCMDFCCSRCIFSNLSINPPFFAGFFALLLRLA
jgi:hypothetical protein